MNTNHLQSIKQANKQTIRDMSEGIVYNTKRLLQLRAAIKEEKRRLFKLVEQQKDVKRSISAAKVARPAGSRRKHNKSDPRYVAWYTSSHAARNADTSVGVAVVSVQHRFPHSHTLGG